MWDDIWPYIAGILPTILVAAFFYRIMKNMIEGDRQERVAQAQWERSQQVSRPSANQSEPSPDEDYPAESAN